MLRKFFYFDYFSLAAMFFFYFIGLSPAIYHYFAITERVNTKNLLVESWIPEPDLRNASKEFIMHGYQTLFTIGSSDPHDYFMFSYNGKIIFFVGDNYRNVNKVGIKVFGSKAHDEFAHLNVYVDEVFIGDTITTDKFQEYFFQVPDVISSDGIKKIEIEFDNDAIEGINDRNLMLKELIIDQDIIDVFDVSNYYVRNQDTVATACFRSQIEKVKYYLRTSGVPENNIITVSVEPSDSYKTYNTSQKFYEFCEDSNLEIASFNIYSPGFHARRSLKSYQSAFIDSDIEIGIISGPVYFYNQNTWISSFKGLKAFAKETIGIFYYALL